MAMEPTGRIEIRRMTEEDLDGVMEVERQSFQTPWSRGLFERELLLSYAHAFVAVEVPAGGVVGYLCFWLVEGETHILNLAVHPERRRQGIAFRLLRYGLDYSRHKGAKEITLEVRRSNYKAIALYRGFHFQPEGIRRRYYSDSGEDAIIMTLHLAEAGPPDSR
jgi:[ribosomal protein S18]-alanine N-acetyltransferase